MVLIDRYAGVGVICPVFQVATQSGGNLTESGTLFFSFQLQNRAGFNESSDSISVTYSATQKIVITIPDTVLKPGWDIHNYIISAGTTADQSTHVVLANITGYNFGSGLDYQSVVRSLPVNIELSENNHIALAPSIATTSLLPTSIDRLDGQIRWITTESRWLQYKADSFLKPSADVIAADLGNWVQVGGSSTHVSSSLTNGGSDFQLSRLSSGLEISTPPYPGSLSKVLPAWKAQYWLYNADTFAYPAGTEFGIDLSFNGISSPALLSGLFYVEFIGYVNAETGDIRKIGADSRLFQDVGSLALWTPTEVTPFIMPDDLQPGEAIAIAVKPFFSPLDFDGGLKSGDVIGVVPSTRTLSGDFNSLGDLLPGGIVFYKGDKYRVTTDTGLSFYVLSGTALVGNYSFPQKPKRLFFGLATNTANQKVIINGNAAVFVKPSSYSPTTSEAIRAIVSTELGESSSGIYSSVVPVTSGSSIVIKANYPCDINGFGTVRSNYPDVLAGTAKGKFNPKSVNIYLQRQDTREIRKFSGFLVIAGISQTFTLTDWASGTVVSSSPTASSDFSLYASGMTAITLNTGGTFPVASYTATYSFVYDGSQVTKISHATPPCIREWSGDFQPASLSIGTVTTLSPGTDATAVNVGSSNSVIINLGLPSGSSAYTATTSAFIQPLGGLNVTVAVVDSSWMSIGQPLYISNGGTYTITSIFNTNSISIKNVGYNSNTSVNTTIPTNQKISPGGLGDSGNSSNSGNTLSFDKILTDMNGSILVNSNGNIVNI